MLLEYRVCGIAGPICAVCLDGGSATVPDLRAAIVASSGILVQEQRLFHGLQELQIGSSLDALRPDEGCNHVELLLVRQSSEVAVWLQRVEAPLNPETSAQWFRLDAPRAARENRVVALAAVARAGGLLEVLTPQLRADREVVLAAVAQDGHALRYAASELQGDREVVLAAVAQRGDVLLHTTPECQADREVVLAAVAQDGCALPYAAPELRSDREVVLAALAQSVFALRSAAPGLWADREFVLGVVALRGDALEFAAPELRGDREVALAAVAQDKRAWEFVSPRLRVSMRLQQCAGSLQALFRSSAGVRREAKYRRVHVGSARVAPEVPPG